MRALGVRRRRVGVVGRARHEHRGAPRAFGHEDDGVQFDTVAHRDHHLAAVVVEGRPQRRELGRRLARQRRILCGDLKRAEQEKERRNAIDDSHGGAPRRKDLLFAAM